MATIPQSIISHWSHFFDAVPFSTKDFYLEVQKAVEKRNIPDVKMSEVSLSTGGMFSSKRLYLKVTRKEFVFHVCAAPFGTGFFVSWWLGEEDNSPIRALLQKIPFIGGWFSGQRNKTFFQIDTEGMFKGCIQSAVKEAIEVLTSKHGMRMLDTAELNPQY